MNSMDEAMGAARRRHMDTRVVPFVADVDARVGVEGSGCFYERGGGLFFVTAAHVAEPASTVPDSIGVPERPGGGVVMTLGVAQLGKTQADPHDVAVYRLDEEGLERHLRSVGYYIHDDTDVGFAAPRSSVLVYGWPSEAAVFDGTTLRGAPIAMVLRLDSADSVSLFMEYPDAPDVPCLTGISGCPVFQIQEVGEGTWSPEKELTLVGLEHAVKRGEYIRGTRWSVVQHVADRLLASKRNHP